MSDTCPLCSRPSWGVVPHGRELNMYPSEVEERFQTLPETFDKMTVCSIDSDSYVHVMVGSEYVEPQYA